MAQEMINDNVEICTDCYSDHHEGRAMHDTSVTWTDNTDPENYEDSGITDFSSSPCGCCGTTLAGSRYRMAIWEV